MQIIIGTIAVILAFIISCFSSLFSFLFSNAAVEAVKKNLDMNIKPYYVEYHEDTHGGFHGDGEEIIIFAPNPEQIEKIKKEWKKTPVEPEIALLIFSDYGYNGNELCSHIPNTDGYWLYINRADFISGYAYNFSFAFFDGEKVYYYELDT